MSHSADARHRGAPANPHLALRRTEATQPLAYLEAIQALRWGIIKGELAPGTRLGEERISGELGLSRGPVRDALKLLDRDGLVVIEPFKGARVAVLSELELREVILPVRAAVERAAVLALLPRFTDEDASYLEQIVGTMRRRARREGTLSDLVDLDIAFHRYIIRQGGLHHAIGLWNTVEPRLQWGFYRLGQLHERRMNIVEEHIDYLDALASGDSAGMVALLEEHFAGPFRDGPGRAK